MLCVQINMNFIYLCMLPSRLCVIFLPNLLWNRFFYSNKFVTKTFWTQNLITVGNVAKNFHIRNILLNIKGYYMKESISFAGNVANNFLERDILQNTEGKYMKELNILASNAANNFLRRAILQNTNSQYMKE